MMSTTKSSTGTEQLALQLALLQANYGSAISTSPQLSPSSLSLTSPGSMVNPLGLNSSGSPGFGPMLSLQDLEDMRLVRAQNTTECVPVPTSEHVAEIVGKQGKIP